MNKNYIELVEPTFMEGVNKFIGGDLTNNYRVGSLEYCMVSMGRSWARENNVNDTNLLTKMLEVKDWRNLDIK